MRVDPARKIVKLGRSIGKHMGRSIPAYYVTGDGVLHEFDRLAYTDENGGCPLSQLRADEGVIAPGLIYREAQSR
jgi:hypothetical protein